MALRPENDVCLGLENLKEIAEEMPLRTIPLIENVERVTSGSKGLLPGSRPRHGMSTFRPFEGTTGPTTCVKDGITNSPDLLGIHILLRGTA